MEKPVFGPMLRAFLIAAIALLSLYFSASMMSAGSSAARDYPYAVKQSEPWIVVWGLALVSTVLAAWIVYRVVRERFPPAGVHAFPALSLSPVAEVVMSVVGGLLFLPFPLLVLEAPLMHAELDHRVAQLMATNPHIANKWTVETAERSLRNLDWVTQMAPLLVLLPFALMLLLWRPIFHVAPGKPLVRYRIGGWLPWTQMIVEPPVLGWEVYYGGGQRNRYPIGRMLRGRVGKKSFDIAFVGLDWPEPELERLRGEWHARLLGQGPPR